MGVVNDINHRCGCCRKPSDRHKSDRCPPGGSTLTSLYEYIHLDLNATPTSTSTSYINHYECCQMTSTIIVGAVVNPRIATCLAPSWRFYLDITSRATTMSASTNYINHYGCHQMTSTWIQPSLWVPS
eukprot:3025761-Amphidinium_carterae.1